jgi:uncharacterized membrane protein YkvA (DUF1232 family)
MGISDWKAKAKALKREVYALYLCSRHPNTPWRAKLCALVIVAYALSPIDLIPDFIPVIGYLDDLVLIPLGVAFLIRMMPEEVLRECREKALHTPPAGKIKSWSGAFVIVCIWAIAICVAFRLVTRIGRRKG